MTVTALGQPRDAKRRSWRRALRGAEAGAPVCTLALPAAPSGTWQGPRLQLSLPSFSGGTPEHPGLLRYACQLAACIRLSPCAVVRARLLSAVHAMLCCASSLSHDHTRICACRPSGAMSRNPTRWWRC